MCGGEQRTGCHDGDYLGDKERAADVCAARPEGVPYHRRVRHTRICIAGRAQHVASRLDESDRRGGEERPYADEAAERWEVAYGRDDGGKRQEAATYRRAGHYAGSV